MHPLFLLFLPLIGLIVFWLLPLPVAIPVYIGILALSGVLYWIAVVTMKKRPQYSIESLIGTEGKVISRLGPHDEARYIVKAGGELWSANSNDTLKPDDIVTVISATGLKLQVTRTGSKPVTPPPDTSPH